MGHFAVEHGTLYLCGFPKLCWCSHIVLVVVPPRLVY